MNEAEIYHYVFEASSFSFFSSCGDLWFLSLFHCVREKYIKKLTNTTFFFQKQTFVFLGFPCFQVSHSVNRMQSLSLTLSLRLHLFLCVSVVLSSEFPSCLAFCIIASILQFFFFFNQWLNFYKLLYFAAPLDCVLSSSRFPGK